MIWALIILALWAALLAPGVVRWFRNHQPTTSIASFHRQLRGLEHTGPKLVEPAYRLDAEDGAPEWEQMPRPAAVPRLVLLTTSATDKESTMRYDDRPVDEYDDAPWDDPWGGDDEVTYEPVVRARTVRAPRYDEFEDASPAPRGRHARGSSNPAPPRYDRYDQDDRGADTVEGLPPEQAGQRRRRILVALGTTIAVTFVLGLFPSLGILWVVTFLAILAAVTYLGLMLYAANAGLYGASTSSLDDTARPVARVVVPAFGAGAYDQLDDDYEYDEEDDWGTGRIAAAR